MRVSDSIVLLLMVFVGVGFFRITLGQDTTVSTSSSSLEDERIVMDLNAADVEEPVAASVLADDTNLESTSEYETNTHDSPAAFIEPKAAVADSLETDTSPESSSSSPLHDDETDSFLHSDLSDTPVVDNTHDVAPEYTVETPKSVLEPTKKEADNESRSSSGSEPTTNENETSQELHQTVDSAETTPLLDNDKTPPSSIMKDPVHSEEHHPGSQSRESLEKEYESKHEENKILGEKSDDSDAQVQDTAPDASKSLLDEDADALNDEKEAQTLATTHDGDVEAKGQGSVISGNDIATPSSEDFLGNDSETVALDTTIHAQEETGQGDSIGNDATHPSSNAEEKGSEEESSESDDKANERAGEFVVGSEDKSETNSIAYEADEIGAQVPPVAVNNDEVSKPYCGAWGVYRLERHYANLDVLFLLYKHLFLGEETNASEYLESLASRTSSTIGGARDKDLRGKEQDETKEDSGTVEDSSESKSVNAEFVEGLDDIYKFFEGVDPPDELDVGAVGSSIQEVLMGQGSRIVIKRVSMAFRAVCKAFVDTKDKLIAKFKNEDGIQIEIKKEDVIRALETAWKSVIGALRVMEGVIEDVFAGDQGELYDDELRELALQMQQTTGSGREASATVADNDEMQELIGRTLESE